MRLDGYHGPHFINDITHPMTLIAFLLVILLGGWVTIRTWF
ncbi:hypothetical protein DSOL_1986 [Desulfosporosinus metallidurans]|uniref:Uncharacterized protein n=1 Tax=Desulfosporosinus metallidurans TaxID=1888891 RepID=A0A1Q8QXQ5_9FIRM|nr:hypothetical protein DSOL_1986 [Desulfosporosinus metallidurans]